MTPIIITLIVIGVVLIIVSCFIIDKSTNKIGSDIDLINSSYLSSSDVKRKIEDTLLEVSEDTVSKTEDELSKISNEKIIAVNDFSNLVLDKITTNHEEVVFLYNMLNEKETELKEIISQVNQIKKQQTDNGHKATNSHIIDNSHKPDNSHSLDVNLDKLAHDKIYNESEISEKDIIDDKEELNNNQRILKLHKQGKSIVDIAKELKLGQGEVKLVIDLYR